MRDGAPPNPSPEPDPNPNPYPNPIALSLTPTLTLPLTLTLTLAGNAHNSIVDLQNAGADLIWGKPMPNFTNGEMQLQLAPYLSTSRTRQRMLP